MKFFEVRNQPHHSPVTIFLTVSMFLFLSIIVRNGGLPNPFCNRDTPIFDEINRWRIEDSTIPAEIAWQRVLNPSHPLGSFKPDTGFRGFIVNAQGFLYWQGRGGADCDHSGTMVNLDLSTGAERWRYTPPNGRILKVFPTDDGYIQYDVSSLIRLDASGGVVWTQDDYRKVPFRSFGDITQIGDILYIRHLDQKVLQFDYGTGGLLEVDEWPFDLHAIWNDYVLVGRDDTLSLNDWQQNTIYTIHFPARIVNSTSLNPYVRRIDDLLIFSFKSQYLQVNSISERKLIWSLSEGFSGIPAIFSGYLVLYNLNNSIEFRDLETGEIRAQIHVERYADDAVGLDPNSVWITGYDNKIFLSRNDTNELIAIEYDV